MSCGGLFALGDPVGPSCGRVDVVSPGFFETIGSHRLFGDLPRRVASVTVKDVAEIARSRFDHNRGTVGILLPSRDPAAPPASAGHGATRP